jgi:hypothetical protein
MCKQKVVGFRASPYNLQSKIRIQEQPSRLSYFPPFVRSREGCAVAQVVRYRLLTAEAQVLGWVNICNL